jgi:S-DNA-T family DNA segregation ATPase FtsK/SpoIIIE
MTYSLNTLNASSSDKSPPRTVPRLGQEAGLALGLLALVLWLLALLSYSPQDAAWSTSGVGAGAVHNWAGRLGAWLADGSYFALGFSVWWGVVAAVYAWLAALARWMRAGEAPRSPAPERPAWWGRMLFWGGLLLLLCASTALEWSRLYRFESALPGHAGGLLGYWLGPVSMQWLGFTGSGLVGIALVVVAVALVFGFSWGHLAEALGARIEALVQSGRARRELARDVAEGKRAAREREEVVFEERQEIEVQHPQPVQSSSRCWSRCPRAPVWPRNARSRCSPKCPTAACRRWTCSTAPRARRWWLPKRWR